MADLKEIIEINISRETRGVTRQGFGTPLFITEQDGEVTSGERVRTYTSADAVLEDFGENSTAHTAALRFFGQQISPTFVKIGIRNSNDITGETITEAFSAIKEIDDDFYFVTAETHDPTEVEEIADLIEAESKIYVTSYNGTDATDPVETTDIGSVLQAKDLARTMIIYAEDPTEYPECAFVGLQAPKDPGSTTWKFKTVSGVTVSRLTTTQSLTLKGTRFDYGKGYNTYENFGGRNILSEGRMVNGEFVDIIRFADWLEARMRERIYLTLVNSEKIPYTAAGFAIIEGRMREVLQEGVAVGGLGSFNVTVPNPRTLDPNLRANRVAEGFEFTGVLAGAVHFVSVQGRLTI